MLVFLNIFLNFIFSYFVNTFTYQFLCWALVRFDTQNIIKLNWKIERKKS